MHYKAPSNQYQKTTKTLPKHYQKITKYYQTLPKNYQTLPKIIKHFRKLPNTTKYYQKITKNYQKKVTDRGQICDEPKTNLVRPKFVPLFVS